MESELQRNACKLDAPPAVAVNGGVLPTDVLHEILLRLPAKVLCRFRLVCQSWRSLTSDPIFAKAHSSRHPLVVGLRSIAGRGRRWRSDHEVQLLDPFSGNIVRRIPTRKAWHDHELSTHLGLLCISERRAQQEDCILSPATGEILMVPTTGIVTKYKGKSMTLSTCLLGRVPSTGEYKALRVCRYHDRYLDGEPEQTYHVATLGRDAIWRVKPCPAVRVAIVSEARAVVNGVAYFLLDVDPADSDNVIAAFNLCTEEWRNPMLRGPLNGHHTSAKYAERISLHLADLNGCLASICRCTRGYPYDNCSVDLWFLVDLDKELWIKQYSLRSAPFGDPVRFFTPLAILDDERILLWVQGAQELRAYDPRTTTWTKLSTIENIFDIAMYQGSLLC
ncbi:unnamed protein product [Urochloa decumbens]|uniref:F-box domain-containing protein n=1 Tax=Urochloa decumbens TaxID=240449 RepID=A0ABC9G841_9POAL